MTSDEQHERERTAAEREHVRKQRCIPCMNSVHAGCWGFIPISRYLVSLYWCECPCGTGEQAGLLLGNEQPLGLLRVIEQRASGAHE